jgi:hypothetical protein
MIEWSIVQLVISLILAAQSGSSIDSLLENIGPEGLSRKNFKIETQCESMAENDNWGK